MIVALTLFVAAWFMPIDRATADADANQGAAAITIAQRAGPDYLDPALSYKANGWEPLWVVYTPLLTYRHESGRAGVELIPGLADALPQISPDGHTFTFHLRPGLHYSDGSTVSARDFGVTIFRVLRLSSQGAANFEGIEGAAEVLAENAKPEAERRLQSVSGIRIDDVSSTIAITLEQPNVMFPYVMAMPFAGLVPSTTPIRNLSEAPPPGCGPFKITRHDPKRQFVLERNELFDVPGLPKAQVDKIVCRIVDNDVEMTQDVIADRLDYMFDPPALALRDRIRTEFADRYREQETPSTHFFCVNTRIAPFNDERVRRALDLYIDRDEIAKSYRGLLAPGRTFIPPGLPGHDANIKAGKPKRLQAKSLIQQANVAGAEVVVFGPRDDPGKSVCEYLVRVLGELGFTAKLQCESSEQYFVVIGNKPSMERIPFVTYNTWFMDYAHPANFFFLVHGRTIREEGNQNPGMIDDARINETYDQLVSKAVVDDSAWAKLDRYLVDEKAYVIPFGSVRFTTFLSSRMDFAAARYHMVYQNDYTSFRLKSE